MRRETSTGFTLTELLIALLLLGLIATFTIPKVIPQNTNKYKAIGKEAADMIYSAYGAYLSESAFSTAIKPGDLTPYMNYLRIDTTGSMDDHYGEATLTCTVAHPCLRLHSGASIWIDNGMNFGGSADTNMLSFEVDPNGTASSTTNSADKSVMMILYTSGRVSSLKYAESGSANSAWDVSMQNGMDPPWFSWN